MVKTFFGLGFFIFVVGGLFISINKILSVHDRVTRRLVLNGQSCIFIRF